MATHTEHRDRLRGIRRFPSLIVYLRDEMGWPVETDDFDDLTFDYTAAELGIDPGSAAKIQEIKRLRPLATGQPWGIFFVKFEPKRLPVVALRRILSSVVLKKRASANRADQQAWSAEDILFVSNYGVEEDRRISIAHFTEDKASGDLPVLKVLGWDGDDTNLHLDHVADQLTERLRWPDSPSDADAWRRQWSSAFDVGHREVITTSKGLAVRLAQLARDTRRKALAALEIENERGPLRTLMAAFKESLVHDLDADGFADMYAQTIAYGLLSARVSRQSGGLVADNMAELVPVTNPFLKELLETFLHMGGRRKNGRNGSGIDFDELGINEVVQVLRDANMEAVLRDFGDKNPQEDPVIHFYELFLKEYDAKKRTQRGVFYTPRPVVSYIVRSVHELLRTEFGLEDGLADTATWGDMAARHEDLKIPEGVSPGQDFVQILDPATGTGTFLVEAIDVIHKTLAGKWKGQGHGQAGVDALWNEYVPKHLLTRLHGYELLMAPYAIAHLKVGLKLHETGYRFGSDERVRVYLTNALEPAQDNVQQVLAGTLPALAHEAAAVNEVKADQRFTVLVGNPPYAVTSANNGEWITELVADYYQVDGKPLHERNPKVLKDDYVKFLRLGQFHIAATQAGVLGYITNHSYIANPTFRGQRSSFAGAFTTLAVYDLHGNARKKERTPAGTRDDNVFDILQGVAILFGIRTQNAPPHRHLLHADLHGTREEKYCALFTSTFASTVYSPCACTPPFYTYTPDDDISKDEYYRFFGYSDVFSVISNGFKTHRDHIALDFGREALIARIRDFIDDRKTDQWLCRTYRAEDSETWSLGKARQQLREASAWQSCVTAALYRPFDMRVIFYHDAIVDRPRRDSLAHMTQQNIGVIVGRQGQAVGGDMWDLAYCGQHIADTNLFYRGGIAYAPLYVYSGGGARGPVLDVADGARRLNIKVTFRTALVRALGLEPSRVNGTHEGLEGLDVFHYIYAVLHSPAYRTRYAEFLKIDFPRLPLPGGLDLFRALAALGGDLVALHLMESPALENFITEYLGGDAPEVEKVTWSDDTVWLDKAGTTGFRGVPEDVWNFHIGGYQVCHKWLKDRKGRTLSDEDIAHYQKIVVALSETIRIMAEIDEVIEAHGGWPGAFATSGAGESEAGRSV